MAPLKITYLELTSAEMLRPRSAAEGRFRVMEAVVKQWQVNRFMYLTVGGEWAWTDKRGWTPEQWQAHVADERLRTFVAFYEGSVAGYFELKDEGEGSVEVGILGLMPQFIGRGFGGVLVTRALEEGLRLGGKRVWLHTCNRDHPSALKNYLARGMRVFRVETVAGA